MSKRHSLVVVLLFCGFVAAATARQKPQQPLASGAAAVVVDVVVRDRDGNPVTDLRKEDFELIEDGVPQEIGDITVVGIPGPAATAPSDRAAVSPSTATTPRAKGADVTPTSLTFTRNAPAPDLTEGIMRNAWEMMAADQQGYATTNPLLAITTALGPLPGRKTVVFFAEGLSIPHAVLPHFRNVVTKANRGNVSVYTIDAAGLRVHSRDAETSRAIR